MTYEFDPCPDEEGGGAADKIVLTGNRDYDLTAILLDYLPSAPGANPVNDLPLRARSVVGVDDLGDEPATNPSDPPRKPQIAVLSEENRFYFNPSIDSSASTHIQTLKPLIRVPLNIWLAPNSASNLDKWEIQAAIQALYASYIYNNQRVGIWFDTTDRIRRIDKHSSPPLKYMPQDCGDSFYPCGSTPLKDCNLIPDELNVYVVDRASGPIGRYCGHDPSDPSAQPNAIFVKGSTSMPDTIAHEIGHALLRDGDHFLASQNCRNLMAESGDIRRYVTTGQAYRMNIYEKSILNVNGHRPAGAEVRDCPPSLSEDRDCPNVLTDVRGTIVSMP